MMKLIFAFFVLCFVLDVVETQTQYQRTIGGGSDEYASCLKKTSDGGFVISGSTNSFGAGGHDCYILKFNSSGMLEWNKTVGSSGDESAASIIQTSDGGFAITGTTSSFGGSYDVYVGKFSSSGALQWSKTIGGNGVDYGYSIIQTSDGGYAVSGITTSYGLGSIDFYLVKISGSGVLQWSRTIGGTAREEAYCSAQTSDGGLIMAGTSFSSANGYDLLVVKLNSSGILQWSKTIGGAGTEEAHSIIQVSDGGYAVAGISNSFGAGNYDFYVVKLGITGLLQWTRTIGGSESDAAWSIIQTSDGGYAVGGSGYSFGAGQNDAYIVKLDDGGAHQWSKTLGGSSFDNMSSIDQSTDGGFILAGSSVSFGIGGFDLYIVKMDANNNSCGNSTIPTIVTGVGGTLSSPVLNTTSPTSIITSQASITNNGGTASTVCIIGINPISNELPTKHLLSQNYPNPFNPSTNIEFALPKKGFVNLIIYDMLGRVVATLINKELQPGTYNVDWNGSNNPSGVYFYKLESGEYSEVKKMVLIK